MTWNEVHSIQGPFKERKWPFQWIAMCSCHVGIRCNSEATCIAFLREQGCLPETEQS